jgi:SRSO17 transposase
VDGEDAGLAPARQPAAELRRPGRALLTLKLKRRPMDVANIVKGHRRNRFNFREQKKTKQKFHTGSFRRTERRMKNGELNC